MNYYQDITLIPDGEVSLSFLWTKVFTQLHLALAEEKRREGMVKTALSFPTYQNKGLGNKVRVLALETEQLNRLNLKQALIRLSEDYIKLTEIKKIPEHSIIGYSVYSRYQPDEFVERKARRYVRRHEGISYEEAIHLLNTQKKESTLPYIQIKSLSSSQRFSLFIKKKSCKEEQQGLFSAYGLSDKATVPEF